MRINCGSPRTFIDGQDRGAADVGHFRPSFEPTPEVVLSEEDDLLATRIQRA